MTRPATSPDPVPAGPPLRVPVYRYRVVAWLAGEVGVARVLGALAGVVGETERNNT